MKQILAIFFFILTIVIAGFGQSVTVSPHEVTYKRKAPSSEYKKTFSITYPKIKAATPALSRKIEALLSYENAFDLTLAEELKESDWLDEATYEVEYNGKGALSVALSIAGSAAYPDGSTKYIVINTKKGTRATASTDLTNTNGLIAKLNVMLKKEIAAAIKEIKADPDNADADTEQLFADKKFGASDLGSFSINAHGVTFHYDYGFPHVEQALEPAGEFKLSWTEMKPYLRAGGLLAAVAR